MSHDNASGGTEPWSGASFPTTWWSRIEAVRDSQQRETVLNELCRTYWRPLYAFLRRRGQTPADAKDLVQGFLARLVERGTFEAVDHSKGRLRTFLLTALTNYLRNQQEHDRAQRRGGGQQLLSLETDEAERICAPELTDGISPELAYDRSWARTILARGLARLQEEHKIMRKEAQFDALAPFLEGAAAQEYEAVGAALGMKPNTVAVTVFRMKRRLREIILLEVTATVGSREDAESEMQEVLKSLAGV